MDIYCVILEGTPSENDEDRYHFKGAFVTCWVRAASPEDARETARGTLEKDGWTIFSEEDLFKADLAAYRDLPESRECYEKALNEGFSAMAYFYHEDGSGERKAEEED